MDILTFSFSVVQLTLILLAVLFAVLYIVFRKRGIGKWQLLNRLTVCLFLGITGYGFITKIPFDFLSVIYTICVLTIFSFGIALYTNSYILTKLEPNWLENGSSELLLVSSLPVVFIAVKSSLVAFEGFGMVLSIPLFFCGGAALNYLVVSRK